MTESEWLASTNGLRLYQLLNSCSRRKSVLLIAACLRLPRRGLQFCFDPPEPPGLTPEDLERWADAGFEGAPDTPTNYAFGMGSMGSNAPDCVSPCFEIRDPVAFGPIPTRVDNVCRSDEVAALLRDIFGNPFRPVTFSAEWRTTTAVALARGMYESRDFSAMPILADALQDAGCENADVLDHCRAEKQVHVCGCWVVDLVLGKA